MGLEAATYIHQLNPSNPVGAVDPKAQGDDHLRMIKATLQATFPNITGAMTATQANLNQWAGLASAYTWTGQNSWTLQLRAADGTAGAPAFSFTAATNSGLYRNSGNSELRLSYGGVDAAGFSSTIVSSYLQHQLTDGTVGAPALAFRNDSDTGLYRGGANTLVMSAGGTQTIVSTATQTYLNAGVFSVPDGSAGAPSLGFSSDPDTGFYRWGADAFAATSGGTPVMSWRLGQSRINDGSAAIPALTFENDTDLGWFRAAADDMRAATNGVQRLKISNTLIECISGVQLAPLVGSAGAPGIACSSDLDTGIYFDGSNGLFGSEGGTGFRIGYRQVPRSTTATTLAISDVGKCVAVSAAINIPASVFSAGDCISIYNDSAASVNITTSAGTLRLAGNTATGTRALAARGMATLWFNVGGATPEVICSGAGVS